MCWRVRCSKKRNWNSRLHDTRKEKKTFFMEEKRMERQQQRRTEQLHETLPYRFKHIFHIREREWMREKENSRRLDSRLEVKTSKMFYAFAEFTFPSTSSQSCKIFWIIQTHKRARSSSPIFHQIFKCLYVTWKIKKKIDTHRKRLHICYWSDKSTFCDFELYVRTHRDVLKEMFISFTLRWGKRE